jgi:hypothetical protein
MIEDIVIINNFLSKDEINLLMLECLDNNEWEYRDDIVKVYIKKSKNHQAMINIKKRVDAIFNNGYHVQIMRHLNKTTIETTWQKHYDGEYPGIKYGAIIYLNDNFEGGELFYSNLNYLYKPKAGDIVIHPASEKYTHDVYPLISGNRYTLTTFVRKA